VIVYFKIISVKTVQAVVRTNPDIALPILIDTVDMAVGKFVLDSIKLIGVCVKTVERQEQEQKQ
jgi:hypothetical protein